MKADDHFFPPGWEMTSRSLLWMNAGVSVEKSTQGETRTQPRRGWLEGREMRGMGRAALGWGWVMWERSWVHCHYHQSECQYFKFQDSKIG